jgi:hypothetical protein
MSISVVPTRVMIGWSNSAYIRLSNSEILNCEFAYARLTQHTCKYINPLQSYMFRLSGRHRQAFLRT